MFLALEAAGTAAGATRTDLLDAAVRASDRLAAVKPVGRNWEDVPYLSGTLLLARELERDQPDTGARLLSRVGTAVGSGTPVITHGDYAGYAQAALGLYSLTRSADADLRATLLAATDGPLAFARRALRSTPDDGPPSDPWWIEGGYGVRFWQDDLFTQPPGLAMRGATRDGLPADPEARDLAYEWIEAYVHDHRPASADPRARAVPSARERAGFLLWDPDRELFRHDVDGTVNGPFWGRGNGWSGFGLATAARFLDTRYSGARYEAVLDRPAIRALLSRLAGSLTALRTADGGWGTALLREDGNTNAETSATGLITFFLARGINEGWLDREVSMPVVLKAVALLRSRIDQDGDVIGIQPPGTGPDGAVTSSDDPSVNVTYGVGAVLLAMVEASRLPAEDLARLEDEAARPVDRVPLRRTWLVPIPSPLEPEELVLTNPGPNEVRVVVEKRDAEGHLFEAVGDISIPAGATVRIPPASSSDHGSPVRVLTVRGTGELAVSLLALDPGLHHTVESDDGGTGDSSFLEIEAVALTETLAAGETAELRLEPAGLVMLGGMNSGRLPATLAMEVTTRPGGEARGIRLCVPPSGMAFALRRLPTGAVVRFTAGAHGEAVLPFVLLRGEGARPKLSLRER